MSKKRIKEIDDELKTLKSGCDTLKKRMALIKERRELAAQIGAKK